MRILGVIDAEKISLNPVGAGPLRRPPRRHVGNALRVHEQVIRRQFHRKERDRCAVRARADDRRRAGLVADRQAMKPGIRTRRMVGVQERVARKIGPCRMPWARRESNSDGLPHWNLNPARLPIPPRARWGARSLRGGRCPPWRGALGAMRDPTPLEIVIARGTETKLNCPAQVRLKVSSPRLLIVLRMRSPGLSQTCWSLGLPEMTPGGVPV